MFKILVIEDEKNLRETICEILRAENFYVIEAENGRVGVQLAIEEIPNLILCDILMPQLDGYEVLRQLLENVSTKALPFIFLTAKATKQDRRLGMNLGADDYLTKPFTRQELLSAIKARIARYEALESEI